MMRRAFSLALERQSGVNIGGGLFARSPVNIQINLNNRLHRHVAIKFERRCSSQQASHMANASHNTKEKSQTTQHSHTTQKSHTSEQKNYISKQESAAMKKRDPSVWLNRILEQQNVQKVRKVDKTFSQLENHPAYSKRLLRHLQVLNYPQADTYYTHVIKAHAIAGLTRDALALVDEMQERGTQPTSRTYWAITVGLAHSSEDILTIAQDLETRMIDIGYQPTARFYQTLVNTFIKKRMSRDAITLLHRMQWSGLNDAEVKDMMYRAYHGILIDTFGSLAMSKLDSEDLMGANVATRYITVLDEMVETGLAPTVATYTVIFNELFYLRGDRVQATKLVEDHMYGAQTITPDKKCYDNLIRLYDRSLEWQRCLRVLRSAQQDGHHMERWHYNAVISTLRKTGDIECVTKLLHEMKVYGLTPSTLTYTLAVGVHHVHKEWEAALELCNKVTDPDALLYNRTMGVCCAAGQLDATLQLYAEMQKKGLKPDHRTYRNLLWLYGGKGMYVEAREIFEVYKKYDARAGKDVCDTSRYHHLDRRDFRSLMLAYSNGGAYDQAIGVFREIRTAGLAPGTSEYSDVIRVCSKAGKWQLGMEFMRELSRLGVRYVGEEGTTLEEVRIQRETLKQERTIHLGNVTYMRMFEENGLERASDQMYGHLTGRGKAYWEMWSAMHNTGVLDVHEHTLHMVPVLVKRWLSVLKDQYATGSSDPYAQAQHSGETGRNTGLLRMPPFFAFAAGLGIGSAVEGAVLGPHLEAELLKQDPPIHCVAHRLGEVVPESTDVQRWLDCNQ
ncbi:hypothetical protein SARC_02147 [Sphaeroforma arctica JP610]|uniref:Pentacotripeptide-repeat region of PRORP domain-containing protein n=1 Tax=Sphaeroforma arctica JP610 TaxID=667725 RepID=A0A0L0GBS3_9EUKA|nr:hypothetical protein SARC_02147 [Sphaeroforma arctica JP610]KNC85698.1 hypothetical protein SARC_02147 [Sphaeroforma arctica JP610]|eukprot:XP_014159600.1 hypothetical protein SARC_02147 [Sphaeroforma arctica JP610]